MPMNFDAEGSPTHKKCVIENGKLNTLLYNLKTAAVAGKKTTGNASKAGYDAAVAVRPFTMYLENGDLTEEELLAKAGNGVYITDLNGLHAGADPISGDFSLLAGGWLRKEGKLQPVEQITVAGNFYELLKQVQTVGSDLDFPGSSVGSPSVYVGEMPVAGQ